MTKYLTVKMLQYLHPSCADPPFYISDPLYTFLEGSQSSISLILDARPLPGPSEFIWLFNGQPLPGGSNLALTVDSITWDSVSRNDSGMYTVEASNRAGVGNTTFQVDTICECWNV